MNALEDPMTQKNGIVDVVYCIRGETSRESRQGPLFNVESIVSAARLPSSLPFRLAAVHICYDEMRVPTFLNLFQMAMELKYRVRFRTHQGEYLAEPSLELCNKGGA